MPYGTDSTFASNLPTLLFGREKLLLDSFLGSRCLLLGSALIVAVAYFPRLQLQLGNAFVGSGDGVVRELEPQLYDLF